MQKLNKHGLPILEASTLKKKKKEKDHKLCRAKGCIYEGDKQLDGFCVQHYADNIQSREYDEMMERIERHGY